MFDKIKFITSSTNHRHLTSQNLTSEILDNPKYRRENLLNSQFDIVGSADTFPLPPITDFAKKNLFYVQDFNIFHYEKNSFTKRQNFRSFLILYTYSGNGSLEYNGKTYHLSKEDGFFINCMEPHLYKVEGDSWVTGILHMDGPLLEAFCHQYSMHDNPVFHEPVTGKFQIYLEQLLEIYSSSSLYRDWQTSNHIDNILTHLLLLSSEEASKKNDIPQDIRYLMRYMENNYVSPLTLESLADFASISKFHLSKEFKKYTGFSPNDYLISLRINQAKVLLKTTDLPAAKIAHEVGIHDINNFTNLFKKKVGMTPIKYRNSASFFFP